jgi:predicted permease
MAGRSKWSQFIDEAGEALRARVLVQHPGFSAAVIASLAIGISCAAGVFAVVDSARRGPLPFASGDRVEHLYMSSGAGAERRTWQVPPVVVRALGAPGSPVADVAAYQLTSTHLRVNERETDMWTVLVTDNFPMVLGAHAAVGRFFERGETAVVLSYDAWQSEFGGDASVVGRTIDVNQVPYTVVGVASRETAFPDRRPIWISGLQVSKLDERSGRVDVLVRLPVGVNPDDARPRIATVASTALATLAAPGRAFRGGSVSLRNFMLDGQLSTFILVFTIVAILVGFIAAVNFAALMLARGIRRRAELGVRAALGASVGRLARHIVAESLLLCASGGVLAALLAPAVVNLMRVTVDNLLPAWIDITLGWRTVAGSVAVAILFGVFFGLGPALDLARPALRGFLSGAGGTISDGAGLARTRAWLVGIQVALATAVLVAVGALFGRMLVMSKPRPGFDYAAIGRAVVRDSAKVDWRKSPRVDVLVNEARSTPGVIAAGVQSLDYLGRAGIFGETPGGAVYSEGNGYFWVHRVTDGFFDVMRPRLIAGRLPTSDEIRRGSPVAVIPRATAQRLFDGNAVGRRLRAEHDGGAAPTVVGVIDDVAPSGLEPVPQLRAFVPLRARILGESGHFSNELWVRAADPVQNALRALGKHLTPSRVGGIQVFEMEELATRFMRQMYEIRQFARIVFGIFGVALGLSAIGIYGLVTYTAEMRSRELAIREALGATRLHVAGRVLRGALVQATSGVIAGAILATWLVEHLNKYQLQITAAATTSVVAFGIAVVMVLVSSFGPVRAAWKRDLAWALRTGD